MNEVNERNERGKRKTETGTVEKWKDRKERKEKMKIPSIHFQEDIGTAMRFRSSDRRRTSFKTESTAVNLEDIFIAYPYLFGFIIHYRIIINSIHTSLKERGQARNFISNKRFWIIF